MRKLFINGMEAVRDMEVTTSNGEVGTLVGWREPHKPGSTGRVYVRLPRLSYDCEWYPSVVSGTFAPEEV